MTNYALIKNNVVENIIVAESEAHCPEGYDGYIPGSGLSIGDWLDGEVWKRKEVFVGVISYKDYLDRIGLLKVAEILEAAKTDSVVAALVKWLDSTQGVTDLTDPMQQQGWNYLISIGIADETLKNQVLKTS